MRVCLPVVPRSWCRIMDSVTTSACGIGAECCFRRWRERWAPKNSKDNRVEGMFWGVLPMSWRRQVRKYVSSKEVEIHVGKACWRIAWPVYICVVSILHFDIGSILL